MANKTVAGGDIALDDYRALLRRQWAVIVIVTFLGATAALAVTLLQPPQYTSSTSVLVTGTGIPDDSSVVNERVAGTINMDTEAQIIQSTDVITDAQAKLGSSGSRTAFLDRISVTVPANTEILDIEFTGDSPQAAQEGAIALAEAYLDRRGTDADAERSQLVINRQSSVTSRTDQLNDAQAALSALPEDSAQRPILEAQVNTLSDQIRELQAEISELQSLQPSPGRVITEASMPISPSSPKPLLNIAAGVLSGLLLGLAVAVVRQRGDPHIREPADLETQMAIPLLASLPKQREGTGGALASGGSTAGRAYARLRNTVQANLAEDQKIILVTGVSDSRDLVAANLAASLAHAGHEVALVCADRESPVPELLTGQHRAPGLAEYLSGESNLGLCRRRMVEPSGLQVLPPGADPDRATELLQTDAAARLLNELSERVDYIVIEAPPTRTSAEAQTLATLSDLAVIVVRLGQTLRADVLDALTQFAAVRTTVLGAVSVATQVPAPGRVASSDELDEAEPPAAASTPRVRERRPGQPGQPHPAGNDRLGGERTSDGQSAAQRSATSRSARSKPSPNGQSVRSATADGSRPRPTEARRRGDG